MPKILTFQLFLGLKNKNLSLSKWIWTLQQPCDGVKD